MLASYSCQLKQILRIQRKIILNLNIVKTSSDKKMATKVRVWFNKKSENITYFFKLKPFHVIYRSKEIPITCRCYVRKVICNA